MTNPPVPATPLDVEACALCGRPEVEHYSRARVCPTYSMFQPSLGADGVPSHREPPQLACADKDSTQPETTSSGERVGASSPTLDVEACVRLLDELASADSEAAEQWHSMAFRCSDPTWCEERAKHFEERVTTLTALKAALPGMGKDSDAIDALERGLIELECMGTTVRYFNVYVANGPMLTTTASRRLREVLAEAVDAARAAHPEETSADAK